MPEKERAKFLKKTAVGRLKELAGIANGSGRPWTGVYADRIQAVEVAEGWQLRY
jgi:hypothetical protein